MLRQISSVLRKFAYYRGRDSSNRRDYPEQDNMFTRISQAGRIEDLLKLMDEDMELKHKPHALRNASMFMTKESNHPLSKELFIKSEQFAKDTLDSLSELNFKNFNNFLIFLMRNYSKLDIDMGECKSKVKKHLEYLIHDDNTELITLINASCNISQLGWSSRALDDALLQKLNDSANVSVLNLSKLLESYSHRKSEIPIRLRSVISAKILNTPEECFETNDASRILKNLSVLGDFMTSNKFSGLTTKLINILCARSEILELKDIVQIYSFYTQNPHLGKTLFMATSRKLIEYLQNPIPKTSLIDILNSVNQLHTSKVTSIKEVKDLLSKHIIEALKGPQILKIYEFKLLMDSYSSFNHIMSAEVSQTIKNVLQLRPKLFYNATVIKPLIDLGVTDLESYVSQELFTQSIDGSNIKSKLSSYISLASIKNNQYSTDLKNILKAQIEQDIQDPALSKEYIYGFSNLSERETYTDDAFITKLAEKLLKDLKDDQSYSLMFAISQALVLSAFNNELATKVYESRELAKKSNAAYTAIRQMSSKASLAQILNLVNSIPEPDEKLIILLIEIASEQSTANNLYKVAKYINTLQGNTIDNSGFRYSLFKYLELCREKQVYVSFADFIHKVNVYMLTLNDLQLSKFIYLSAVANLLSYEIPSISKEFSSQLIKNLFYLNMPATDSPVSNEFMAIAAEHVTRGKDYEVAKKLLPGFFKFEGNISLGKLYSKINTYVKWPKFESTLEVEFAESIGKRLDSYRTYDSSNFVDLVAKFRKTKFNNHFLIREEIMKTLESKITTMIPKLSKNILLDSLKEYSQFNYFRAEDFFKTFSENILTRYDKFSFEEKVTILEEFARRGYTNKDLVKVIAEDIAAHPDIYFVRTSNVLSSLASLNFEQEPWGQAVFNNLLDNIKGKTLNTKNLSVYFDILFALIKVKRPTEEIIKIAEKFNSQHNRYTPSFRKALINNHLQINPIGVELKSSLFEERALSRDFYSELFGAKGLKYLTISKLLDKHQVVYEPRTLRDKVFIPIYIPQSDTAIWIPGSRENTYDAAALKGEFELHKRHIQSKVKTLVIKNASEFNEMKEEEVEEWIQTLQLK